MAQGERHRTFERASWPLPAARALGLSLALLLVCLLVFEAALRTDYAYELLPLPRPYYSYDVTRRLHYLDSLRDEGPVDVLFIGSSVVRSDLKPTVFDQAVADHGGGTIASFNAGMSNMFPHGAKLYLENLWLDAAEPRFVLHGVREAELAIGSRESRHLRHGRIESQWLEGSRLARLQAALIGHVRIAQYRGALRTMIERTSEGSAWHVREAGELSTDERGFRKERAKLAAKRKQESKRLWKYRKTPKPDRYKHSLPTLDAMRKLCAERGATYVLVNMPEHPERFTHANGPATHSDYQQRIRAWANQRGVPFLDVTDGDLSAFGKDKWYSDFHHMSPAGAERFSTLLAMRFVEWQNEVKLRAARK